MKLKAFLWALVLLPCTGCIIGYERSESGHWVNGVGTNTVTKTWWTPFSEHHETTTYEQK